jgi:hypothetical protein
MDADDLRDCMEDALAYFDVDSTDPDLIDRMYSAAIAALPSGLTVGCLRPFFKDMPSFWGDEHPVIVTKAEPFEIPHLEFMWDDIEFRFCAHLEE